MGLERSNVAERRNLLVLRRRSIFLCRSNLLVIVKKFCNYVGVEILPLAKSKHLDKIILTTWQFLFNLVVININSHLQFPAIFHLKFISLWRKPEHFLCIEYTATIPGFLSRFSARVVEAQVESSFAGVLKSLMSSFRRSFLSSTLFSQSRKRNLGDVYDENDTSFILCHFITRC